MFQWNLNNIRKSSGFSTIIAMLLTAFLTVLSAGILNLFLRESQINHFMFDGIATYMWAEWSLEYALLKTKNHREGFSDAIKKDDHEATLLNTIDGGISSKKIQISYSMQNSGKNYSGTINKGSFEIIPLFYDDGISTWRNTKDPNQETSNVKKSVDFLVNMDGDLVWNIVGNDTTGATFGIVGTGSASRSFGSMAAATMKSGFEKYNADGRLQTRNQTIANFLVAYENSYLILYSTSDTAINYSITSSNGFSFPTTSILASSSTGNSKQNIEFRENRSRLFDMLKYSLFNK